MAAQSVASDMQVSGNLAGIPTTLGSRSFGGGLRFLESVWGSHGPLWDRSSTLSAWYDT